MTEITRIVIVVTMKIINFIKNDNNNDDDDDHNIDNRNNNNKNGKIIVIIISQIKLTNATGMIIIKINIYVRNNK